MEGALRELGGCLSQSMIPLPKAQEVDEVFDLGDPLGRTNPSSSSVKVLRMVRGAQAYANFKQVLDSVLATQKSSSDSPK